MSLSPLFNAANDDAAPGTVGGLKGTLTWHIMGGNNIHRIGANCGIAEYDNGNGHTVRLGFDIGALFGDPRRPEDPALADCDYVIPDVTAYLRKQGEAPVAGDGKLDGLFLTHAHVDHIGALGYLLMMGYALPPVYATPFTAKRLEQELANHNIPRASWPPITVIAPGQPVQSGDMCVTAFSVSHSTPQSVGFYIDTPAGSLLTPGDFKLDPTVTWGPGFSVEQFKRVVKNGVDVLLLDSTGADRGGKPVQEADLRDTLHKIIKKMPDKRLVITTMSGFEENLASCARVAAETGKAFYVAGASHEQSLRALAETGLSLRDHVGTNLDLRILGQGKPARELAATPPGKAMAVVTGALGKTFAELTRASEGKSQKLKLDPKTDIILFCAPSIPGQEGGRLRLINQLRQQGFTVLTHHEINELYPRAHAGIDEMRAFTHLAAPKTVVPIHGSQKLRQLARNTAQVDGFDARNADNGQSIVLRKGQAPEIVSRRAHDIDGARLIGIKAKTGNNWKSRDYFAVFAPQSNRIAAAEQARANGSSTPKMHILHKRR